MVLLGLRLLSEDTDLHDAIRKELTSSRRPAGRPGRQGPRLPAEKLKEPSDKRRKLLELHYADQISSELFAEEERKLTRDIEIIREEAVDLRKEDVELDELATRFEQVAATRRDLDVSALWEAATEAERRILFDHLEVKIHGAPRLNVTLSEVGLSESESQKLRVGGGIRIQDIGDTSWSGMCQDIGDT